MGAYEDALAAGNFPTPKLIAAREAWGNDPPPTIREAETVRDAAIAESNALFVQESKTIESSARIREDEVGAYDAHKTDKWAAIQLGSGQACNAARDRHHDRAGQAWLDYWKVVQSVV